MSHGTCATVRIKVPATNDNPEGIVVINAEDKTDEMELADTEFTEAPIPEEPTVAPPAAEGAAPWLINK